jgi:hypothetical protein
MQFSMPFIWPIGKCAETFEQAMRTLRAGAPCIWSMKVSVLIGQVSSVQHGK